MVHFRQLKKRLQLGSGLKSIRSRIVLLFGSSMVLLFGLFIVFMYLQISNTVMPLTTDFSQQIVAMQAERIGAAVDDHTANVKTMADGFLNGMMVDMATMGAEMQEMYADLLKETMDRTKSRLHPQWTSLVFADTLGTGYDTNGGNTNVADQPYYQAVVVDGAEVFVGSPSRSTETGEHVFIVAHQVMNSSQEKVGVMAATVKLQVLAEIAESSQINSQGFGWIVDNAGLTVTHPDPALPLNFNLWDSDSMGYTGLSEAAQGIAQQSTGFQPVKTPDGSHEALIYAPIPSTSGWSFAITLPLDMLTDRINAVIRFVLGAGVVIVLVALVVAYSLSGTIARPIEIVAGHLDRVAKGDFTQRLDWNRKDEVGRIASAFNQMSNNLRNMLQQVETITQQVSSASQQLSAISEENSATIEETASSLGQFAATVESVNDNVQDMVGKATSVQELSSQGTEQMELSSHTMDSIANTSTESTAVMGRVQQAAERIANIVKLISDIAGQTNLLALNAAIEAASAGEHGRGFAVVADEVRNLSLETKKSAADISRVVEQLTAEVNHAVEVIGQNSTQVTQGSTALSQTQTNFAQITENITDTVRMINEVASAAQTLEMGSREIASSSQQQSASMDEIARSAAALAQMSKDLEALMTQFTIA